MPDNVIRDLGNWHTSLIIAVVIMAAIPFWNSSDAYHQSVIYDLSGQVTLFTPLDVHHGQLTKGCLSTPFALYLKVINAEAGQVSSLWIAQGEIPEADYRRLSRIIVGLRRAATVTS